MAVHTAKRVPDILARIVSSKLAALERVTPSDRASLERRAASRTAARDFRAALTASTPAIIAEIKKASPSKGILAHNFDPSAIAKTYASGGAAALSVLTDTDFFQGSLQDLEAARAAVAIPVLRKDFTVTEYHVIEAAAHGADAILLIAAILDQAELRHLRECATQYRMAALVEVHDASELDAALASGAEIIGVNNRNLHTFEVTLETSLRLAEKIPSGVIKVAESGIDSPAAIQRLQSAGFQAFLVGEHLMKSPDPAAALKSLRSPLPTVSQPTAPASDRTASDRPASDRTASARPASDRTASDRPASDRTASDRPASDRPASDRPASDRISTDRPASDRTASDRTASDRISTDRPPLPSRDRKGAV